METLFVCREGHLVRADNSSISIDSRCTRCRWNNKRRQLRYIMRHGPTQLRVGINRRVPGRGRKRFEHENVRVELQCGWNDSAKLHHALQAKIDELKHPQHWSITGYVNITPGWSFKL